MRTNGWISFLVVGVALVGCSEDVGSSAIRTKGMYANYEALSEGDGKTTVTAELRVGGDDGTYVVLEDPDQLVASAEGDEEVMDGFDDGKKYRTTFDTDEGGTVINIAFERGEDENAPDSSVKLPEPFTLGLADFDEGVEIARGEDVAIVWDPGASGEIDWEVTGDCIWSEDDETKDDGSFTIPASAFRVTDLDKGESCEVTITLERSTSGRVDRAFEEGGEFEAKQRRRVTFTSTPAPGEVPDDDDDGAGGAGGSGS